MNVQKSLKRAIETPAQLLVEGRTAEIFFRELVEFLHLQSQIEVRDFGDIDNLTAYLETFTQLEKFIEKVTSLGIIRDAEDKPAKSAFSSVCSSLKTVRIEPPENIGAVAQNTLKIGVFILPDCQNEGMLETLCLRSVSDQPASLACIDGYFDCLEKNGIALPKNKAKARTWTFLAAQNLSDPQVGRAAQAKIFPWNSDAFKPLREFISALTQA